MKLTAFAALLLFAAVPALAQDEPAQKPAADRATTAAKSPPDNETTEEPAVEKTTGEATAAAKTTIENHAALMGELESDRFARSLFNPDQSLYRPPLQAQLLRMTDDFMAKLPADLTLDGKVALEWSGDAQARTTRAQLRELYLTRSLGDFTVTAGRRILKWTNGYAFSPAGVLDPPRNPADPQDRLGRLGGRDLLQLDWFRGSQTVTLVYSFPFATRAGGGERVVAARYNVLVKGIDVSAIAALPSQSPGRLALSANYVVGEALELHGEASLQRGTDVAEPRAADLDDPRQLLTSGYFQTPSDHRTRLHALAGMNLTFHNGANLIAEVYHTDEGLTSGQWDRFITQSEYAASLRGDPRYGQPVSSGYTLPEVNLLQGLTYLRTQQIRRDYGFLRLARGWKNNTVQSTALALVNLHDGSFLVTPEISFSWRRQTAFYLRGAFFFGNRNSQYGNVPMSHTITAGVRRYF